MRNYFAYFPPFHVLTKAGEMFIFSRTFQRESN
jgi:hypothetical protein